MAFAPHPFIIEPPVTEQTYFQPEDTFDFTLLLFGEANEYLPYFIYSFERMGENGLGKGAGRGQGAFKLLGIDQGGVQIYDPVKSVLLNKSAPEEIGLDATPPFCNGVKVHLITPLRFKSDGCFSDKLPFQQLARIMLRRVSSLMATFGDGEPNLDYRELVYRARLIETVDDNLKWFDWTRYSNRQERSMRMGGLTGTIRYHGDLDEYLPLLTFCQETHLGKQTTFGLGQMEYDLLIDS